MEKQSDQTDQQVEIGERIARYAAELAAQKSNIDGVTNMVLNNMQDLVSNVQGKLAVLTNNMQVLTVK